MMRRRAITTARIRLGRHARLTALLLLSASSRSFAANVKVETLLANLHEPRGVVVRPDSSGSSPEVFVAESGAGRVVAWNAAAKDTAQEIVVSLPSDESDKSTSSTPRGPQALLF